MKQFGVCGLSSADVLTHLTEGTLNDTLVEAEQQPITAKNLRRCCICAAKIADMHEVLTELAEEAGWDEETLEAMKTNMICADVASVTDLMEALGPESDLQGTLRMRGLHMVHDSGMVALRKWAELKQARDTFISEAHVGELYDHMWNLT